MDYKARVARQWGCGVWLVVMVSAAVGLMALVVHQGRTAGRYPLAQQLASHSNYSRLPREFRWDDAYLITDADFHTVYTWYSLRFDTGPEKQALGSCILLESEQKRWVMRQRTVISLCQTERGTAVYISRATIMR